MSGSVPSVPFIGPLPEPVANVVNKGSSGSSPGAYWSWYVKEVARSADAKPPIGTVGDDTGSSGMNQGGDSIPASGGIVPGATRVTAVCRSTRP